MSRFVLDASMTMAWCFEDEATPSTNRLRDRLVDDTALVPLVLWDLEVWNALLVAFRRARIRSVEENVRLLLSLPLIRVPAPLESVLMLAKRHRLSSYDALYLGLATRERLPLATLDPPLAKAARAEGLDVLG